MKTGSDTSRVSSKFYLTNFRPNTKRCNAKKRVSSLRPRVLGLPKRTLSKTRLPNLSRSSWSISLCSTKKSTKRKNCSSLRTSGTNWTPAMYLTKTTLNWLRSWPNLSKNTKIVVLCSTLKFSKWRTELWVSRRARFFRKVRHLRIWPLKSSLTSFRKFRSSYKATTKISWSSRYLRTPSFSWCS